MDLQVCLDFFQIISYITDDYSKDDSGTIEYLKKAKKDMMGINMVQQLKQMANVFLSHRRMGEAEAAYRGMPDMHLSESNVNCVFVLTGFPETRFVHATKVSDNPDDPRFSEDSTVFEIDDRRGLYKESATVLSKYERRGTTKNLHKLTYAQFCKEYGLYRKASKDRNQEEGSSDSEDDPQQCSEDEEGNDKENSDEGEGIVENIPFHDRIHTANDEEIYRLPDLIKLTEVVSGEAPFMKRKTIPYAIRIHKPKDKNSHEWIYSQVLLYRPFQKESVDLKDAREDKNICEDMFLYPANPALIEEDTNEIRKSNVIITRRKIMPFIEDVEEGAREQLAAMNTERIAEEIDAENVQNNDECYMIGTDIHPDYEVQHPDFFHEGTTQHATTATSYRRIELWHANEIGMQLCKLDPDQRYVVDLFIKYARTLRLAEKGFCRFPTPPLYICD